MYKHKQDKQMVAKLSIRKM